MASIEERAIELMNTLPVDEPKSLVYEAYKIGATNQRKIDIEKAWKVFEKYATYIHPRKGEESQLEDIFGNIKIRIYGRKRNKKVA